MAIREGVWDCPYCGATGIRGPETTCPGCGAARDEDVKFYLPEDAKEITDEETLARAKAGADWRCSYCGAEVPAGGEKCVKCGAVLAGSEKRETGVQLDAPSAPAAAPAAAAAAVGKPAAKKGGGTKWFIILLVLGGIAAALYFFVFRTHAEQVEVLGHKWERVIQIEKFQTVTETAWADKLPSDARELSRSREKFKTEKVKVGTKKVKVGKKDLGNGYFEDVFEDKPVYEDKPIFKDKVRYQVDRWKPSRKARATGTDLAPKWPAVTLADRERAGKKTETYQLRLKTKDGEETFTVANEKEWRFYEDGKSYKAEVRASGGVSSLAKPAEQP